MSSMEDSKDSEPVHSDDSDKNVNSDVEMKNVSNDTDLLKSTESEESCDNVKNETEADINDPAVSNTESSTNAVDEDISSSSDSKISTEASLAVSNEKDTEEEDKIVTHPVTLRMETGDSGKIDDTEKYGLSEEELEENKSFKLEEGEEEFKGFPSVDESQVQDIVKLLSEREENELQQLQVLVQNQNTEPLHSPTTKRKRGEIEESDLSSHCSSPALSISSQLSALSFSKRSRTGSPASRGSRKSNVDLSNPKYLVPFEFGWRREVVTRGISAREDGISRDVYYFHPSGKKLRSLREVSEKLTPGVTIENFTFYKEPLGADPKFETIRNARCFGQSPSEHTKAASVKAKVEKTSIETPPPPPAPKETPKGVTPLKNFVKTPKETISKPLPPPPPAKREKLVLKFNKGTPKIALKKPAAAVSVNGERKSPKMLLTKLEGPKPHPNAPSGPRRKITPRKKPLKPQNNNKDERRNRSEGGDLEMGMLPPLWSPTGASAKTSSNESLSWSHLDENYTALLNVFQYLKVQELLRAGRVCRLWRDIAGHSSLWRTVRMKNSQVSDWKGFTDSLSRHGTKHLDLRKMLVSLDETEEMWMTFAKHIANVKCLERLDMCRCSVNVIEQIIEACPHLLVFNAQMIGVKDQTTHQKITLENLSKMKNLRELRMKSFFGLHLVGSLNSLTELAETLTTLSLTSVKNLGSVEVQYIGKLHNLEALELGECSDLPENFPSLVIGKLLKLKRIRLEKGPWKCSTNEMLYEMSKLKDLMQLELINFDIRPGFDEALASCANIKRLLLIPTYVTQSATTNNIILSGAFKLWKTLTHFVWVVTMELLKVTELFVDQCEGKGSRKSGGNSVPVLKPVPIPEVRNSQKDAEASKEENITGTKNPTPITVIPIDELFEMLKEALPNTRVKLLKIPFQNTWRQSITEGSA
ncbi:UNVERIFIED_CONTAM: hypothetical protein PYX00_009333 [Menopon gallinae]|uniref:MBD domain-containing protein n=1 Tax=Menopon gallinae TaxID=328185 RepID=A0AAW2HBF5_9NEOP